MVSVAVFLMVVAPFVNITMVISSVVVPSVVVASAVVATVIPSALPDVVAVRQVVLVRIQFNLPTIFSLLCYEQ